MLPLALAPLSAAIPVLAERPRLQSPRRRPAAAARLVLTGGGVFGIAICAAVFASRGGYASPAAFTSGFVSAMDACAGLALLGALAGLCIPGKSRPARPVTKQPTSPQPVQIGS